MSISTRIGLVSLAILAGCTGAGPNTGTIMGDENAQTLSVDRAEPYVLVDLSTTMAELVSSATGRATPAFFRDTGAPAVVIGAGDVLDITIVVTSENGFIDFTQSQVSPVATTDLPPQEVGSDGMVNVPPIGRVNARGQTVQQFERFLTRRLGEVLVEPSVIVSLSDRKSATAAVLGDVTTPGSYSLNQDTRRILDVIGKAGGPTGRSENLVVSLNRKGQSRAVPLDMLYRSPALNVAALPGDVISVEPFRTDIRLLGALGVNDRMSFDTREVTLSDVLARAGGVIDRRADRKGVFIYRETPKAAMKALGADVSAFEGDTVPAVFRLDISKPTGFFAANRLAMQDGDIVYVSDSLNEQIRAIFGAATILAPAPAEYVRDETL